MHYCDKCGEKLTNINEPCPTCGIKMDNSDNTIIFNEKRGFSFLIIIIVLLFGGGLLFIKYNFSSMLTNHEASNYTIFYDSVIWSEYDVGDGVYALVNNLDKDLYLQFPAEADEIGLNLNDEGNCQLVYNAYVMSLRNAANLNYSNISSSIKRLEGTDHYYLTADYNSYFDDSRGKLYVILNDSGKAINILLNMGNNNIVDIEKDIYDILKKIEM